MEKREIAKILKRELLIVLRCFIIGLIIFSIGFFGLRTSKNCPHPLEHIGNFIF